MESREQITQSISPAATAAATARQAPRTDLDMFPIGNNGTTIPQPLEAALLEKANAVSAEFVEHYRKALGNLLMTLRADLEGRATADWERLYQQAQRRMEEVEQRFKREWGQEQERRLREDRQLTAGLQEARHLFEAVQEQLQSADLMLRQQVASEREQLLVTTRQEVDRLTEESRRQIGQQVHKQTSLSAELQSRAEQVREAHEHVKALLKILPKVIQQRTREVLAPVVQELQTRLEGEFSTETDKRMWQLQQHSVEISERLQNELRRKGLEQLERREAELLDHIKVRLEEVRATNRQVQEQVAQAGSSLDQRAAALWAEIGTRIEVRSDEILEDAASRLEERVGQFRQAAEAAVGRLTAQAWNHMQRSMEARFRHQQEQLEQKAADLQALFEQKQQAVETWLRQSVVSVVEQARGEAYTRELERGGPEARAWLFQETQKFKKMVQDAVLDASAQIHGRIQQQALEIIQEREREACRKVEALVALKIRDLPVAATLRSAQEGHHAA